MYVCSLPFSCVCVLFGHSLSKSSNRGSISIIPQVSFFAVAVCYSPLIFFIAGAMACEWNGSNQNLTPTQKQSISFVDPLQCGSTRPSLRHRDLGSNQHSKSSHMMCLWAPCRCIRDTFFMHTNKTHFINSLQAALKKAHIESHILTLEKRLEHVIEAGISNL